MEQIVDKKTLFVNIFVHFSEKKHHGMPAMRKYLDIKYISVYNLSHADTCLQKDILGELPTFYLLSPTGEGREHRRTSRAVCTGGYSAHRNADDGMPVHKAAGRCTQLGIRLGISRHDLGHTLLSLRSPTQRKIYSQATDLPRQGVVYAAASSQNRHSGIQG